ncbi:MAG: Holliday junction resolvase RuvX [Candidatus Protistobacter heckmanni]|nr:Holliday junction resolvase RuvX [Candidatus Protistobacter heckmanni]
MPEGAVAGQFPAGEGILLGFDYGEARIGVAVGNTLTQSARALGVLPNRTVDQRFGAIAELICKWRPAGLIVGLPVHPDGAPHHMTQRCRRFGNQLHGRTGLPVAWVDERYSSAPGEDDAEAARVILQQYLDSTPFNESKHQ